MAKPKRPPMFDEESRFLDRFGLLLLLTITTIVSLSLVDLSSLRSDRGQQLAALVTSTISAIALLVALRAAGLAKRYQRIVDAVVIFAAILSGVLVATGQVIVVARVEDSPPPLFPLVLSVLAPIVVVRRLLTHRRVRRATLLGAVSAYLLIPVAFFYVFHTIEVTQPEPFFGQAEPTTSLMYFSLTTITTVGYGDLVAVAQPGRLFANAEALIGQLYLVTFVGLLIGILTQQSRREESGSV